VLFAMSNTRSISMRRRDKFRLVGSEFSAVLFHDLLERLLVRDLCHVRGCPGKALNIWLSSRTLVAGTWLKTFR
jgi:hypothetical protein